MSSYRKAIIAFIPALIAGLKVLSDALGDGAVSSQEWVALALAVVGALGVYAVPNDPPAGRVADPNLSERGVIEAGWLSVLVLVLAAIALLIWIWQNVNVNG